MTWRGILAAFVAVVILDLVLIQPNHPDAVAWGALLLFPLELPVILMAMLGAGASRVGVALRVVLVVLLTIIAVLKAADFVMFTSLSRGFNPVGDMPFLGVL